MIGSGFGRTGTLSTKKALEELGFGPCDHMEEVLRSPRRVSMWHDRSVGRDVVWAELFDGFRSTVDFPASAVFEELLAAYPDAKVLHTIRDADRWYDSTYETIFQARTMLPALLRWAVPPVGRGVDMIDRLIWDGLFEGRFEDRERAIEIFEQHTAQVRRVVPAERLLVFSVADGWEPLCAFLDVPVPPTPFPRVNDRESMMRRFRVIRVVTRAVPVLAVAAAVASAVWWFRR